MIVMFQLYNWKKFLMCDKASFEFEKLEGANVIIGGSLAFRLVH